jgi:hypothetical protein
MKEDFNRVVVFDFSKMTDADVEKAKVMLSNIMPGFNEVFEKGFKKKEIILDDVLNKLDDDDDIYCPIKCIINTYPGAAISVILHTIALMMDENYPDHISTCDTVYYHSFLDGKIHSIPTNNINKKAFKYFAAFRTQEDAVKAIRLTQAAIKYLNE